MTVNYSRSGNTLTVTITQDVSDLVAKSQATKRDRVVTALNRCQDQLRDFVEAADGTSAIDDQITALQAKKAALPNPPANF